MTINDFNPEIAIIGCGIGGLVTALQLHANGFTNIKLFEASNELRALGVGINVQPHAILVLRDLGLLPALENTGVQTRELVWYDRWGNFICNDARGRHAGYKVPQISIHRGNLQMLLLDTVRERLGEDQIYLGHALSTYVNEPESVHLEFINKRTNEPASRLSRTKADIVIAADGINSTIRKSLYPDEGPARFSGRILWRGSIEGDPFLTGASMVCAGHADQKFLAYPISATLAKQSPPRSQINWIAELRVRSDDDPDKTPPARADWTAAVPKERFAGEFKTWKYDWLDIPGLIEHTAEVFEYPMCDRDPIPNWTFGRLTLLGDAAHPMYPIGSNGASQAILDAACITRCLKTCSSTSDITSALKAYESERLPITARIVHANRGNGPDHVCELARERAPDGFKHVSDVFLPEELEEIGSAYKRVAGFEMQMVNELAVKSENLAEERGLKGPSKWLPSANGIKS